MIGIFTAFVVFSAVILSVTSEGNIGCLFSDDVCHTEEWCFDDHAFGRCLPLHGRLEEDSFYQYDLQVDVLEKLEEEMSRLFRDGYHWTHAYTQCIVQNLLFSHRFGFDYRPSLCEGVSGVDGMALDLQEETLPRDLAVIHFDPTSSRRLEDELSDFASEWFIPPLNGQESEQRTSHLYGRAQKYADADDQSPVQQPLYESNNVNKFKRFEKKFDSDDYVEGHDEEEEEEGEEPKLSSKEMLDLIELLSARALETSNDDGQLDERSTDQNDQWDERNRDRTGAYYSDVSPEEFDQLQALFSASAPVHPSDGTPDGATDTQTGWLNDDVPRGHERDISEMVDSGEAENPSGYGENFWDDGFKRLHRYDVKKPGPNFMNNLDDFDSTEAVVNEQLNQVSLYKLLEQMFQDKLNGTNNVEEEQQQQPEQDEQTEQNRQQLTAEGMVNPRSLSEEGEKEYETSIVTKPHEETDESEVRFASDTAKRKPGTDVTSANGKYTPSLYGIQQYSHKDLPTETTKDYDVIDVSYAFITTKNGFENWKEGAEFVKQLEKMLNLPEETFSNIRVDKNQVTFKVNENPQDLNASAVAGKAESMATDLYESTGKMVTNSGIGNQVKISILNLDPDKKLFIITFVVCGCIAGILIAVAVLYVIRRHARSKEKLQALAQPETEPSHDYQDLCRQRMANKSNEKPEPIHVGQRVTSLSRESETSVRSPSSRSSTSSWSEEPVSSNMDISTGHMVLSYMEDHLKNKDRLDQEWVALCAYEAEPCNTSSAQAAENVKKNRYPDVLPYDHSRVVLNDLTNINGSDYINASTITDHDPRNPAYIATQGPLPHTAADFWQMVWEQGSVVVVTLSRLVENGIAMCHRYWPEEGSELYHIYEVHLVSEHIWCDDYLVRSFYLKNLKTGETRTVTQFHFLSWPDNGVPVSVKALLDFRRKVNKSYRGRSCPIVVHCSDGSGRTGTYCLIDMVLNRMAKGAKEIDIAATLEHIRDQRCYMVKTKSQFEFALMAVAEEVHAILKALPQ